MLSGVEFSVFSFLWKMSWINFRDWNKKMFVRIDAFNLLPEELFQFGQLVRVFFVRKRDRNSGRAGAPGSSDAMHILFHIVRHVVVDHV